uniref:Tyrosine-protein kinase n=1 Tax=Meloidogyne incognita TaxID=6306 RepID=A0A914NHM0_MELIC
MSTDALWRLPYYHGLLPREDAVAMLKKEGDFIIRTSEEFAGDARSFVLSTFFEGVARHYIFRTQQNMIAIDFKKNKGYATIQEFVEAHLQSNTSICSGRNVLLKRAIGRHEWELSHSAIKKGDELGSGAFGVVRTGTFTAADGTVKNVAIKEATLSKCTKDQIKEFMNEARVMRKFKHPNVIFCYGVAVGQEPLMIVMDLATEGALKDHLQRQTRSVRSKLYMCLGAASGLSHVHERNVVHCDVAARNCLFSENKVKIADFGLARELEHKQKAIKLRKDQRLPIKWLAPETMIERACTKKSDVWAYGVLCWEIFSNGAAPYAGVGSNNIVARKVITGDRLKFSDDTPEEFAELITNCVWNGDADIRCSIQQAMLWMDRNILRLVGSDTASVHTSMGATATASNRGSGDRSSRRSITADNKNSSRRSKKSGRG